MSSLPDVILRRAAIEVGGELAGRRADVASVVAALLAEGLMIFGGEIWWLRPDGTWTADVPDASGVEGCWTWDVKRESGETGPAFAQRAAETALDLVAKWPDPESLPPGLSGEPLYNLEWGTADGA